MLTLEWVAALMTVEQLAMFVAMLLVMIALPRAMRRVGHQQVPATARSHAQAARAAFSSRRAVATGRFGSARKRWKIDHIPCPSVAPNAGGCMSDRSNRRV